MTSLTRTFAVAAALCIAAIAAQAQAPDAASTPKVDKRQARQQAKIDKGEASGALTPRESQRLEKRQAGVAKAEENAKADGTVTAKERRHLDNMQDRNRRAIKRQKHDKQASAPAA